MAAEGPFRHQRHPRQLADAVAWWLELNFNFRLRLEANLFAICPLPGRDLLLSLPIAACFDRENEVHPRLWRRRQWHRQGRHWYASQTPRDAFFVSDKLLAASSTGLLLKMTGLNVTSIKIDPYMNIDAGTMRPQEHGEHHLTQL